MNENRTKTFSAKDMNEQEEKLKNGEITPKDFIYYFGVEDQVKIPPEHHKMDDEHVLLLSMEVLFCLSFQERWERDYEPPKWEKRTPKEEADRLLNSKWV